MAQFAVVATTSVHVLRVRRGSTILDTSVHLETTKSTEDWAVAAEQSLLSQPDNYFGRFGNVSVNNVYTVKDTTDASPPAPPVRLHPGIHKHGMRALKKTCLNEMTMVHVGMQITWQLLWHAWCV